MIAVLLTLLATLSVKIPARKRLTDSLPMMSTGGAVYIHPASDSDAQRALDTHPEPGTQFVFKRGIHAVATLQPLDGQVLIGERGAVLHAGRIQ